ncbi:hypothetical protein DY023_00150 [Microbacterium bovistercoris]|uniref:HNH nuclease domain-containing protein n=1 Tax=Microbacterium bovistercoris TaxID=2293570 RepID=A0A371NYJ1_9MICO|nr:RHS repeat-associated core domain-containing protein [Microbacterium bovistercoris]REJ08915.1 hypothetical protein DY023_00150 [Microbacterium bovistercoris]
MLCAFSRGADAPTSRTSGTGGGLWWLSPDPVGTVGLQINAATGVVTRRWMDPYGVARGGSATWSSNFGYLNQPKSVTGLTQLGARAYDSALGRFVTVDPLLDTSDPRHSNAYAYAFNSPISYSDASGLRPIIEKPDGGWYTPPKTKQGSTSNSTPVSTAPTAPKKHGRGPQATNDAPPSAGNSGWKPTPILGVELKPYTPLTVGSPGWRAEIEELDRNCGSRENATGPCEIDQVLDPAWKAAEIAMQLLPVGRIIKGLRGEVIPAGPGAGRQVKGIREQLPVNGAARPYPEIIDPRSGTPIHFPGAGLKKVPPSERVSWGGKERAAYIREWYDRGYDTPEGGWSRYDIHHIQPREYGGNNDFRNLVPGPREIHQQQFNTWWREY